MNRRNFFLSTTTVVLAAALPASMASAVITPKRTGTASDLQWQSLEECRAHCGRRFRASGPVVGRMRLEKVVPAGSGRQFIATFEAPVDAPEGLYRLESGRAGTDLFLQTVRDKPGRLEAVFSLID